MIKRLEEQLKQLEAAKDALEERQNELQAMMKRLEESKVKNLHDYALNFFYNFGLINFFLT